MGDTWPVPRLLARRGRQRSIFSRQSEHETRSRRRRHTSTLLDLETRQILWSFFRPTAERNWPFGHIAPVNGGLWVNSYQTLVKLE